MRTLILCGGKGTRAYPHTLELPKPLLEVAGRPVLAHLMEIYAAQGFTDFVLAAGFKFDLLEAFAATLPTAWRVEVKDTGVDTNTGGRVARCAATMGDRYFVTYADGLGDVDLHALARFHEEHSAAATLTTVPLPSQYGTIECDQRDRVTRFLEKPRLSDHWINAGFLVFDQRVEGWMVGEDLERDVLPALSTDGELCAYRHEGFWASMDTYKDAVQLTALCGDGHPPWVRSPDRGVELARGGS
ncbi:MAG: sugar phosphate nucleotidyltransferase [Acidimicrobiales bacterium]